MKPELLTITEASRITGVSRQTIYAAIADKRLPERHLLGRLVVTEKAIRAAGLGDGKRGRAEGKPIAESHKTAISESQKRRWAKRKAERNE